MLRNYADARRCSYFELGLPVFRAKSLKFLQPRKALDNIDLNQMSHRYVSGVLQNDCNDLLEFRSQT